MNRKILLFTSLFIFGVFPSLNAQLKVSNDGNVGIKLSSSAVPLSSK